jgi:hypothetical protein
MKSLFPPIESLEPWVDKYTGKTNVPSRGEEAEKHDKQHSMQSSRRLLFLEGSSKPARPQGEAQEAEILAEPQRPTKEFIRGASKFFGGNHLAHQGQGLAKLDTPLPSAPMRNVPLKHDKVALEKEIQHSGEGLKQSAQHGIEGRVKARDAQPAPSESTVKQSSTFLTAHNELTSSEKLFNDLQSKRAVQSYTPTQIQAQLNLKDASKAKDIVLEILSRNLVADTMAKAELKDIASKLTLAPVEKTALSIDLIQQAIASSNVEPQKDKTIKETRNAPLSTAIQQRTDVGAKDLKIREAIQHAAKTVLSTDVILAIQRSQQINLKDDGEEQLRIGTWAVHVLAGRMDTVPAEILRGMKKDALQALGRLSMQLLSSSAKSARAEYEAREPKTLKAQQRRGGHELSIFKASGGAQDERDEELGTVDIARENIGDIQKSAIKSTNEFFRMETVQGDLQALQNNIKLDFTADMLVEGFIEALRNDDMENATEMRTDVLTQFSAQQSARAPQGKDTQASRTSLGTFGFNAKANSATNTRNELFSQRGVAFEADTQGDRSVNMDSKPEIEMEQTTTEQQDQGAWANAPLSKYID